MTEVAQLSVPPKEDENWEEELTNNMENADAGKDGKKGSAPEDHPTKLGRKVKEMSERFTSLEEKLTRLVQIQEEALSKQDNTRAAPLKPNAEDSVPEYLKETLQFVKSDLKREQEEKAKADQEYFNKYIVSVKSPKQDIDEELHKAVIDELLETNYKAYTKTTGDPAYDAQVNFDRAVANILKRQRKSSAVKPNVHGNKKNAPLGLSASSMNTVEEPKKIEPDIYARKFLAAIGEKEDATWVQESLRNAK